MPNPFPSKDELKELVRSSVKETLNGLLEQEAQQTHAARYKRSEERQGCISLFSTKESGGFDLSFKAAAWHSHLTM